MARVDDPDGLATLLLKYRVDPSTNLNVVTMANNGAGLFSAAIPGQAAGALVAFHVQASDNFSPSAATLFPDDAPVRECLRRSGPLEGTIVGRAHAALVLRGRRPCRERAGCSEAKDVSLPGGQREGGALRGLRLSLSAGETVT